MLNRFSVPGALLVEDSDEHVLNLTIDRRAKANSLSLDVLSAMDRVLDAVAASDRHRVLILAGGGSGAFSAGADINELASLSPGRARHQMLFGQEVFRKLELLPQATIAAIEGYALGGGLELALACDIRICAPGTRLGLPEMTLGNIPGWGGTQRLPRLVGRGLAMEMILTGEPVGAERALQAGLVNLVTGDVRRAAAQLAASVAARNPVAVREAKRAVDAALHDNYEAGMSTEADGVASCCATDFQRETVARFLEGRAK